MRQRRKTLENKEVAHLISIICWKSQKYILAIDLWNWQWLPCGCVKAVVGRIGNHLAFWRWLLVPSHPEECIQRASAVVAEFSDEEVILVDNVNMASDIMRMALQYRGQSYLLQWTKSYL